jgi:adhesin transport system membrane fusion protein
MALKDKLLHEEEHHDFTLKKTKEYTPSDLAYMSSLSGAILQKSPVKSRLMLWIIFGVVVWLTAWASLAEIDELTRGVGRVIPSHQLQVIQNLEGGILSEILVDEGELVEKGQILVKIDDTSFSSSYEESLQRLSALKAKSIRLEAEATNRPFKATDEETEAMPDLIRQEKSLYVTNKRQLESSIRVLQQQVEQRKNELKEAQAKQKNLSRSYESIKKELEMTRPMMEIGIVSKVEFLQLERRANDLEGQLEEVTLSIPRIKSTIVESQNKVDGALLEFQNKAKEEWNAVVAEMHQIMESIEALSDRVRRTSVRSPVKGVVKRLLINTINGVVQPGMDILEIVPLHDTLLIEAKIKPQDIAYIYPGQKAMVKFTAYDFTIYGGLEGKVTHISADTIIDEQGDSYYLVRIKTDKNYLEKNGKKMEVIVGMTANVDIITGKKSVLDYMLKPILKAKYNAMTER